MEYGNEARPDETAVDLVLALCHEIGNIVGAIRLNAHLLDPEMAPRELARTAVDLDDLSARSSALLMQVRPLLRDDPPGTPACDGVALLDVVRELLIEQGGQGTALRFDDVTSLPPVVIGSSVLRALICGFAFKAIESSEGRGFVRIGAERRADTVCFVIEDDAEVPDDPVTWREAARRGRPLQCAVASHILARFGGSLEVDRHTEIGRHTAVTRIALVVPIAEPS